MKECQICKKAFPNNSKLRRHEKGKFHLKKAEKVSKATNTIVDDFVVSPVREKSKKNFKECQICKKVFPNNSKLRRHEKVHVNKAVKVLEVDSEVEVKKRKSNKSQLVEDSSFEDSDSEDEATDHFELNNDDIEMANDEDSRPSCSLKVLNLTNKYVLKQKRFF